MPAWVIPWPPIAAPAEEQFPLTLTAGYRTGASNTQYTGFGTISGTPIGTLSPDSSADVRSFDILCLELREHALDPLSSRPVVAHGVG